MSLRTRMKSLTTEAISYQVNETFLYEMETIYKEMQEFIMSMVDPYKYYKSPHFKERLRSLEKILSDRFNVNVIIGYNIESDHFSTYGNGRSNFKSLGRRFDPDKTFKQWAKTDMNFIKELESKDLSNDKMRELSEFFNGISLLGNNELLNNIKNNPISLDFKNVRFVSKPKYYSFYLNHDFIQMLSNKYFEVPFTPMEVVAINMHELGHCWDNVASLFKIGNDIEILQDTVREQVAKSNYDFPNIVKIYYDKTGIKEEPSKNITTCLLNLNSVILKRSNITNINKISINIEQQADEFSARFGLGAHLTSAVSKIDKLIDLDNIDMGMLHRQVISNSIVSGSTFLAGVLSVLAGTVTLGLTFMSLGIGTALYTIYKTINSLYFSKENDQKYDITVRRLERIKNTTIRRLKFVEDRSIKEEIICDIDHISNIITQMKEQKKDSKIKIILDNFLAKTQDKNDDKIADMLEDLMSNDIYVGYQKLKMLQERL